MIFFLFGLLISRSCLAIVNGHAVLNLQKPEAINLILSNHVLQKNELNYSYLKFEDRCSGIAISDYQALSAGHCVRDETQKTLSIIYAKDLGKNNFSFIQSTAIMTDFISEDLNPKSSNDLVPGCSIQIQPIPKTKTVDLAIIEFPRQTFSAWAELDTESFLHIHDAVEFYGFGSFLSSFENYLPILPLVSNGLRKGNNFIWRMNDQRIALLASPLENYADIGDSGAPVFKNGKVVGIINTLKEKCETELGEDYGFTNSISYLSSLQAKSFLRKYAADVNN